MQSHMQYSKVTTLQKVRNVHITVITTITLIINRLDHVDQNNK